MNVVTLDGKTYLVSDIDEVTLVEAMQFSGALTVTTCVKYEQESNLGSLLELTFGNQVFTSRDLTAMELGYLGMAETIAVEARKFAVKSIENTYMDTLLGKS